MFASELDNAERMFHVSQGRPPSGYFCTEERKGDRHSPRAGDRHSPRNDYMRGLMRKWRAEQREAREAA
jgi:hypothetical protein